MEDLKKIVEEISLDQMMDRIHYMTENFPYRLSGSETEEKAARYVTNVMESYGMEAETLEFDAYNSTPMESKVEIISPEKFQIDSLPCGHIRSTGKDGRDFEIVYVADGSISAYEGKDVRGKMVLVEVSYAPPVPEKAYIAAQMGAAGIMCMNWGNDEEVICHRALKSVWGNPTPQSLKEMPDLIGVGITRHAGLRIKGLCQRGEKVIAKVTAIADRKWSKVRQPYGIIRGNGESDEFMLVASHLDAWQPGVTCNATGNATTLELCRVLTRHREQLKRDIHVVFWNGHEIAEAAGSTWFLDHYWDLLNKKCIAYMHIDSTGVALTKKLEIKSSDELYSFARNNVKQMKEENLRIMTLKKIGDQSFMGIGIPSLCQRISFTEEDMEKAHGATLGWWNHTKEDGIDKCDPQILYQDTLIHAEFVYTFVNSDLLPYDFRRKFDQIEKNLYPLAEAYQEKVDFTDVLANLKEAKELVLGIQNNSASLAPSKRSDYNEFVKIVSRSLTNIFQTYGSKFDQDRYGHTNLTEPIPLLAEIKQLDKLEPSSLEYGLIETLVVRNKNRITDGLKTVIDFGKVYKKVLL